MFYDRERFAPPGSKDLQLSSLTNGPQILRRWEGRGWGEVQRDKNREDAAQAATANDIEWNEMGIGEYLPFAQYVNHDA